MLKTQTEEISVNGRISSYLCRNGMEGDKGRLKWASRTSDRKPWGQYTNASWHYAARCPSRQDETTSGQLKGTDTLIPCRRCSIRLHFSIEYFVWIGASCTDILKTMMIGNVPMSDIYSESLVMRYSYFDTRND